MKRKRDLAIEAGDVGLWEDWELASLDLPLPEGKIEDLIYAETFRGRPRRLIALIDEGMTERQVNGRRQRIDQYSLWEMPLLGGESREIGRFDSPWMNQPLRRCGDTLVFPAPGGVVLAESDGVRRVPLPNPVADGGRLLAAGPDHLLFGGPGVLMRTDARMEEPEILLQSGRADPHHPLEQRAFEFRDHHHSFLIEDVFYFVSESHDPTTRNTLLSYDFATGTVRELADKVSQINLMLDHVLIQRWRDDFPTLQVPAGRHKAEAINPTRIHSLVHHEEVRRDDLAYVAISENLLLGVSFHRRRALLRSNSYGEGWIGLPGQYRILVTQPGEVLLYQGGTKDPDKRVLRLRLVLPEAFG